MAQAFIAKATQNLPTTEALMDRLKADQPLRRMCGFSTAHRIPGKPRFSRAFAEFALVRLAECAHEALGFKIRSGAERVNARLKDSHGGKQVWMRGHAKIASRLMFGIAVIAAAQLLRLLQ